LDLRAGTLRRSVRWTTPANRLVQVETTRLVSLTHRSIAAICYEVTPLDGPARVVLQSELVANEDLPRSKADPRLAAVLDAALDAGPARPGPGRPDRRAAHRMGPPGRRPADVPRRVLGGRGRPGGG